MRCKIFTFGLLLPLPIATKTYSQYEGPNNPAAAQNSYNGCLSCPGGEWVNTFYTQFSDMQYSDVTLTSYPYCFQTACYYSRFLFTFNFGFDIPAQASIKGVKAEIIRKVDFPSGIADTVVSLFTTFPLVGDNKATTSSWSTTAATISYGNENDMWGLDLLPADVNNTQFGLAIMVKNSLSSEKPVTASIDNVQLTVYYDLGLGMQFQVKEASLVNVTYDANANTLNVSSFGSQIMNSLSIMNLLGKQVLSIPPLQLTNGVRKISLPSLATGVYFASYNAGGQTMTKKFFVK